MVNMNSLSGSRGQRGDVPTSSPSQGSRAIDPDSDSQRVASPVLESRCHSLISTVLGDENLRAKVCELSKEDAQLMVDYLDIVCREDHTFTPSQRRRALALLCKLAKSARVFPRCYKLTGVEDGGESVGSGGFAEVHKGRYRGQRICLKIFYSQKTMLTTSAKELTLWAHLRHKNILPFYGVCLLRDTPCLVSPWMEKGNLRDYLTNFPGKSRMPFVSDILDGLLYLHSLQIVHSDLKAENILVSNDGRALITDFGVSSIAATSELIFVTQNGGSRHWMAPELLIGDCEAKATKFCDIWSFACLVYEILTNKAPFYQYVGSQVVAALIRKETPVRPERDSGIGCERISDHLWELLETCWDYIPENRPSCQDIRDCALIMGFGGVRPAPEANPETNPAPWEAVRGGFNVKINYTRVEEILHQSITQRDKVQVDHDTSSIDSSPSSPEATLAGYSELLELWSRDINVDKIYEEEHPSLHPGTSAVPASPMTGFGSPLKEIQDLKTDSLTETDTVIALMGPTGSGKSSFISSIAGADRGIGHSLESCTSEVTLTRVRVPSEDKDINVVLVDTPGFDDTRKSDYDVLWLICKWLEQAGHKNIFLDGILYLHRISDNRMAGSPLRCFEVFEKICGPQASNRVVIVTTMWDAIGDEAIGQQREKELTSGPWAPMIRWGSKTERHRNTEESAWQILKRFIDTPKTELAPVQLQKETVTLNKSLPHTDAGQELYNKLNELHKKRQASLQALRKQMEKPGLDQYTITSLQEQYRSMEQEHEAGTRELRRLQVSVLQRFLKSRSIKTRYK